MRRPFITASFSPPGDANPDGAFRYDAAWQVAGG
jgi:hypothetical protein